MSFLLLARAVLVWSLLSQAVGDTAAQDVAALRRWESLLLTGLEEMRSAGGGPCQKLHGKVRSEISPCFNNTCELMIHQDVQRFGRTKHLLVHQDKEWGLQGLGELLSAERLELEQKLRQLQQMIAFLEGKSTAEHFSEPEVKQQVAQAQAAVRWGLGRVQVFASEPAAKTRNCPYITLVKPLSMYGNPQPTISTPTPETADLSTVFARAQSLYVDSFTAANNRWAAMHPLLTYLWLYLGNLWALMVPSFGSGPFMPEASCHSSSIGFLPWWNMFGHGVSCASPLGIVTETVNPGASFWFTSCEFGLLTFCPRPMARSSCWMLPGVGQLFGQLVPGRMLPDRTVFGSHPSGCFNIDGRPDIYTYSEMFAAPDQQGYDMELVSLLYRLAERNASFTKVTFFTTSLTQLAVLGYYPQSTALQHHGVQLTLSPDSTRIPYKRYASGEAAGASVLTLEMMANGLLWALREGELGPNDVHSVESYDFGHLPPAVVADYVLDQRGTTYRDANCQDYAKNLMDRILAHGQGLKSTSPKLGTQQEMTNRFIVLLFVVGLLIVSSATLQWAMCWRACQHMWNAPVECKAHPGARLWHTARALAHDAEVLERRVAKVLGEQPARVARYAVVLIAMLQSPPIFWYVVVSYVRPHLLKTSKVHVSDHAAPLVGGTGA